MVTVKDRHGGTNYYRCTVDGRLQESRDATRWRAVAAFRGKRADLAETTPAQVEAQVASVLGGSNLVSIISLS